MKKRLYAFLTAAALIMTTSPAVLADDSDAVGAMEEINETYDEVKAENTCETAQDGFTLSDGAPDGTKYFVSGESTQSICDIGTDTSEDYMWETDVKFNAVSSGFTVYSKTAKSKVGTCVRRYDGDNGDTPQLSVQTGSSKFTTYCEIDPEAWYHIQLIGQHGTSKSLTMKVGKWEDGVLTYVGTYSDIPKRNNPPSSYILVQANTCIDNVKATKLGADTLTISTIPENTTEVNAGSGTQLNYSASRNGVEINAPEIEWRIFDGDLDITDGSGGVSIDLSGALTTDSACPDKTVTIKAVSTEKGNTEGSYTLDIKSVDLESEKFDTLSLTAEDDNVKADSPLALTLTAEKNGESVEITSDDVVWSFYDEGNLQEIGNKYISVQNNTLYVTSEVLSQYITVRVQNPNKTVTASLPVRVKAADAVESDEEGTGDKILAVDACESTSNEYLEEGSWDGSHYYNITTAYDMISCDSTTDDVIIEADIKFTEENSGFKLRDNGNNKEGGQIARQGDQIGRVGSSNKFTAYTSGNADSWYHIVVTARCGADDSYGKAALYKYDEEGNKVSPDTGEIGEAIEFSLDLRTMANKSFSHIQVMSGTGIDNMRILKLVPDKLTISVSADTLFAGNTVQAACTVEHKDAEVLQYPAEKLRWAIYDADNKYPVSDELAEVITVDNGLVSTDSSVSEQTVYLRVSLADDSSVYAAVPITIKESSTFVITGIGLNEEGTKIEELKVRKDYFYNGDVTFAIAIYDINGALIDTSIKSLRDNTLAIGENKISLDLSVPEDFGSVKAFVWTGV